MWLSYVQLLRGKTDTGRGVVLKNEMWERRSLTRKKLL